MVIFELWAGTGDKEVEEWQMSLAKRILPEVHAIRNLGSAAIGEIVLKDLLLF